MEQVINIQSKEEIKQALAESYAAIKACFKDLPEGALQFKSGDKWTPAENLSHLIASSYPLSSVLNKSKFVFRVFGTSKSGSRSYSTLYETYKEAIKQPVPVAGTPFAPNEDDVNDITKMLSNWDTIIEKFQTRIDKWSESDLDKYRASHPLLGKLTIRELLFFTNFHNYIHLDTIQQGLKEYGKI